MDDWKDQPGALTGRHTVLVKLEKAHFPALEQVAGDKRIWEHYAFDCSAHDVFLREFNKALAEREQGNQFPFVIFDGHDRKMMGSTRLLYLQPAHRKLEIGWTWLHPDYWHTAVNAECKLLLLTYCFETMKAIRVQLKTDANNVRSRKAIAKTGAKFEGILRNDMIRDNGTYRDSAYYSIIDDEWPPCKQKITKGLADAFPDK